MIFVIAVAIHAMINIVFVQIIFLVMLFFAMLEMEYNAQIMLNYVNNIH